MFRSAPRALVALAVAISLAIPAAASAETTTVGLQGWQILTSAKAGSDGSAISQPGYPATGWLRVRPDDAGAPGTEVNALLQNGRCPEVFYGERMKECFGYMSQIGPVTVPQFAVPWWFRTTFTAASQHDVEHQLVVGGVVGAADVWVNGHRVATHDTVQGDYTRFTFDITHLVRTGQNALALEVYPNDPTRMFTLDNVDWTQIPPDNNTGIQFPIQLHSAGPLALSDAHVVQHSTSDFSSTTLTIKGTVTNTTAAAQTGSLTATVTSPSGATSVLTHTVSVPAHGAEVVALPLTVTHPQLWWPRGMGDQPLYGLRVSVQGAQGRADTEAETFGIRTITTRLIGRSALAPEGSRQFLVNGRPFIFRGGGWSEDLFLRYSSAYTAEQVAMIENLNLNGIRTEGKQMPQDFYDQMDRAGILVDAGYQCCDAWQLQDSGLTSAHDFAILANSAYTIAQNLRNHPSILNFSWSDNNPTDRQEQVSAAAFRRAGFQEPLIASAEYKSARDLGPSGEKEGPYDWVPPGYWYDTTHYDPTDSSRTNVGGAWAFDSEASAGATIPTLDSIHRFLTPFEQTQLWTNPDYNQYHLNYEPGLPNPETNGGYSFGTLHDLDQAIVHRYGQWDSLASYVEEAQVQNYETQRAEFEAYIAHSIRREAPSTGVVYWQLNKGWPTMLWDLYNADFDQAGSYFGAKKANEPLHAIYTYDTGTVTVDNLGPQAAHELSVQATVIDTRGHVISNATSSRFGLGSQGVAGNLLHPQVPAATAPPAPAQTYFVRLLLREGGQIVDRNVYWLSTQPDVVNWAKTIGMPQATMSQWADLTGLHSLAPAQLRMSARSMPGPQSGSGAVEVTVTNVSHSAAFFIRADLRRGNEAGVPAPGDNEIRPAFWSDDDITLWPGETQVLRVGYAQAALRGATPVVTVGAWNAGVQSVAAH